MVAKKSKDEKDDNSEESSNRSSKKSLSKVADEVINGEWGTGQDSRLKLSKAGYNPNEVRAEINRRRNQ